MIKSYDEEPKMACKGLFLFLTEKDLLYFIRMPLRRNKLFILSVG